MKNIKGIIIALLLVVVLGCGIEKNKKETKLDKTAIETKIDSKIYKGLLTIGHEVSSIELLNYNKEFWVSDPKNLLQDKYASLTENKEPYTSVYVEVKGILLPKAEDGFAEEYDNVLEVKELIKMTEKE